MKFKNEQLDQLRKTIEITHSKSGQYKTILPVNNHLYSVVTKVSHMTKQMVIVDIKKQIADNKFHESSFLSLKIIWMMDIPSYRHSLLKLLKEYKSA